MAKKIIPFLGLCAYGIGLLGGIGYAIYGKAWFIAACIAVLGVMAFPQARQFFRDLTEA